MRYLSRLTLALALAAGASLAADAPPAVHAAAVSGEAVAAPPADCVCCGEGADGLSVADIAAGKSAWGRA